MQETARQEFETHQLHVPSLIYSGSEGLWEDNTRYTLESRQNGVLRLFNSRATKLNVQVRTRFPVPNTFFSKGRLSRNATYPFLLERNNMQRRCRPTCRRYPNGVPMEVYAPVSSRFHGGGVAVATACISLEEKDGGSKTCSYFFVCCCIPGEK